MGLAEEIIDRMTGKFEPEKFEDRYENAMIELIRSKQAGLPTKGEAPARPANVVNLMDALRRSVEGDQAASARRRRRPSEPRPRPGRTQGQGLAAAKQATPQTASWLSTLLGA